MMRQAFGSIAKRVDGLSRPARLALCLMVAFLFGLTVSHIPAWVGNLAAPWLALPFLAGWVQRSWLWSAVTGVLAVEVCVAAFYLNTLPPLDPVYLGLAPSTSHAGVVVAAVAWWLGFHSQWVTLGVPAGLVFGLLGCWWGRSRLMIAGFFLAAPFLLEPAANVRTVALHAYTMPLHAYVVWVIEAGVGLALLAWVVANSGSRKRGLAASE